MRILGIDPGLQTTGFGVVDVDGHRLRYVASGTVRTTGRATGLALVFAAGGAHASFVS